MKKNYLLVISDKVDDLLKSENLQSLSNNSKVESNEFEEIKSTISSSVSGISSKIEKTEDDDNIDVLLPEIINELFQNFQTKEAENNSKEMELEMKIDQKFLELYELLNKSIIQGEYTFDNSINNLILVQSKIKNGLNLISNDFFYNALQNYKIALDEYHRFIYEFQLKINSNQIFLFYSQLSRYNLNTSPLIKDWFYITENNLNICSVDVNFSVKAEKLNVLLNIYYQFNHGLLSSYINPKLSFNESAQIIFQKVSFLLFKFKMRISLEKVENMENNPSSIQSFLLNLNDQKLESLNLSFDVFEDHRQHLIKHYEVNDEGLRKRFNYEKDEGLINLRINEIKFNKLENLNFIKFHKYIKYHKDYAKKVAPLNSYSSNFEELLKNQNYEELSIYDRYALDVFFQYIQNNILSLRIEQFTYSQFEDLKKEISRVESGQFNSRLVHNYFPFYKFLQSYALNYLEYNLEQINKGENIDIKQLKKNIKFIEEKLISAMSYFDWCNERDFMHVQIPYSNSTIDYTFSHSTEKMDVFMYSGFFLPTNYEKISDNLSIYEDSISRLKNKLDDLVNMEKIKDEIKSYSNKSIEILAIFTAVVVFTLGSIQVLSSKTIDLIGALAYLGIVGTVLSLFTYLIFLITATSSTFHKRKKFFILPSIVSASVFIAALIYLIIK